MLERHFLLHYLQNRGIILLGITGLFFSCEKSVSVKKNLETIAHVSEMKNDVKRRINEQIEWNSIELNEELFQKDFIRTMTNSNAVIKFKDLSTLRVAENSLVVIERPKEIIQKINTKIVLKEGTLDRTFHNDKNNETVSEIKTDRLITYISSQKGKVGINYKKNEKLKIAVYSGETKISAIMEKQTTPAQNKTEKKSEENTTDLLEVAVYDGKADVSLSSVDENTNTSKIKKVTLKKNEVIQVDYENKSKTQEPIKNIGNVDIIKEDFVPIIQKPVAVIENTLPAKKNIEAPKHSKAELKTIILEWKKIDAAEKYLVDFSNSKYFRSIIDTKFTSENKLELELNKFNIGTYYWQVAPIVEGEIKEYGAAKSFEITD